MAGGAPQYVYEPQRASTDLQSILSGDVLNFAKCTTQVTCTDVENRCEGLH